jgi:hypothetical protein
MHTSNNDLKPEGESRSLRSSTRRLEDYIKIDKEIGWHGVDWLHLAQNKGKWRALVRTVIKLRVSVLVNMGGRWRNYLLNNTVRTNMYKACILQR